MFHDKLRQFSWIIMFSNILQYSSIDVQYKYNGKK